jgi:hypothetical protein
LVVPFARIATFASMSAINWLVEKIVARSSAHRSDTACWNPASVSRR